MAPASAGRTPPAGGGRGHGRGRQSPRAQQGLRALGETVERLTLPMIGSQRLLAADLVLAWAALAGDRLAASTYPDRLVFPPKRRNDGTLHLRAASGAIALQVQHESRRLIERINIHLGYPAVARLKVVQAPLPPRPPMAPLPSPPLPSPPPPSPPFPSPAETTRRAEEIDALLTGIEDERLRAALARLGLRVLASAGAGIAPTPSGKACPGEDEPV
ncbi:MAG: DciA family protein [Rhodospirillales bacterium]